MCTWAALELRWASAEAIQVYKVTNREQYGGWLLKGADGVLEANCLKTHRCGMGVVTGDLTECECKQM